MRWKCGRSGRTRTCDLRFWRPLLFQLSYAPARYVAFESNMDAEERSTLGAAVILLSGGMLW